MTVQLTTRRPLFVVAFKVLCVVGCGRGSSGVTRFESGFTPEIATPSQNDQRQLGPLTRLLTQVERVTGRQRHPDYLGRNRRGSSRQPFHRPSLRLATLRQVIAQKLRQSIPHATLRAIENEFEGPWL